MTNMFYVRSTPTQNLMPGLNLHLPDALPAPNFTPLHINMHPGDTRVRRQQTDHPLRVGGHPGLRLRWLWLELGSGKLHKWLKWLEPLRRERRPHLTIARTTPSRCPCPQCTTAPAHDFTAYHRVHESSDG